MANRVLVVGWDGADWDILDPLLATGELPALQELIVRGRRGVSPLLSPLALLGCVADLPHRLRSGRPRRLRHPRVSARRNAPPAGLVPFHPRTDLARAPFRGREDDPASQRSRSHTLRRSCAGWAIAGGVVPPGRTFSSPAEVGPRLKLADQRRLLDDVPTPPARLVAELEDLTRKRAAATRTLLDEEPWDAACIVFVSPDRLQHCLLEYVHPGHPRHEEVVASPVAERVRDVYRLLDRELASLVERTDDEDLVVLMSDHGHQPCTRALSMNKVLEHLGFLSFGRGSGLVNLLAWGRVRSLARVAYDRLGLHGRVAVPTAPIDWAHTSAYTSVVSTGEGVSLNLAGREPEGTIGRATTNVRATR